MKLNFEHLQYPLTLYCTVKQVTDWHQIKQNVAMATIPLVTFNI